MVVYKGKELLVFGGGGSYITKIKKRETFNDIYSIDVHTLEIRDLNEMTGKQIKHRMPDS